MKVVKNPRVFSQEYVPNEVVGRESYLRNIVDFVRGGEFSSSFVITGNPGTGKTLIGKSLIAELKEFRGSYVNCYLNQSDRAIASIILDDPTLRHPDIGSSKIDSLDSTLFRGLTGKRNLIVLDEAHSLKRAHSQIVYMLSRSKELGGPEVKLILISMEEPEMFLDRSTLSGLGKYNRFSLKEYDADALYRILLNRSEQGLFDGSYSDSALTRVSELTEENGSARIALELLRNSALLAESSNQLLDEDVVLRAYRDFSPPLEDSSLISLDREEIRLLKDLIGHIGKGSRFKTSDLKNIRASLSDSRIYKFLKIIEAAGLIKKSKIGKGYAGGVENEYILRAPSRLLLSKLDLIERSLDSPPRN